MRQLLITKTSFSLNHTKGEIANVEYKGKNGQEVRDPLVSQSLFFWVQVFKNHVKNYYKENIYDIPEKPEVNQFHL